VVAAHEAGFSPGRSGSQHFTVKAQAKCLQSAVNAQAKRIQNAVTLQSFWLLLQPPILKTRNSRQVAGAVVNNAVSLLFLSLVFHCGREICLFLLLCHVSLTLTEIKYPLPPAAFPTYSPCRQHVS